MRASTRPTSRSCSRTGRESGRPSGVETPCSRPAFRRLKTSGTHAVGRSRVGYPRVVWARVLSRRDRAWGADVRAQRGGSNGSSARFGNRVGSRGRRYPRDRCAHQELASRTESTERTERIWRKPAPEVTRLVGSPSARVRSPTSPGARATGALPRRSAPAAPSRWAVLRAPRVLRVLRVRIGFRSTSAAARFTRLLPRGTALDRRSVGGVETPCSRPAFRRLKTSGTHAVGRSRVGYPRVVWARVWDGHGLCAYQNDESRLDGGSRSGSLVRRGFQRFPRRSCSISRLSKRA